MAGHSHWAGIKHKKGRADKERSKIFSKLSREITVAAKLGDKDPDMNHRLRSAIQAARSANMPKDNIDRAIDKSKFNDQSNFDEIRYEGFGNYKIAVIVEALTDNKNRTASKIREIFQKNGGNLGTQGSAAHNFKQVGIIRVDSEQIDDENLLEIAINSGAVECFSNKTYHEIHCNKEDIYDNVIKVSLPHLKQEIPLFVLFKALGCISDKEIIHYIINNEVGRGEYIHPYSKLYPSMFISYQITDRSQVQFSYSKRVNRPGLRSLNPFPRTFLDETRIRSGNPFTKPEFSDVAEVNFSSNSILSGKFSFIVPFL